MFVGQRDDFLPIHHDRLAGFNCQALAAGGDQRLNRANANRRNVEPHVLLRLGDFDDRKPALRAKLASPADTGVGTFNRFNGQATNPPLEWSELGPVTKLPQAATKPDFPDTTIAYLRWYWNVLEPEQGKFRWDIVDLAIEEARAHGQTLAIRLMPYSNKEIGRAHV